jgi:hypothetical protein
MSVHSTYRLVLVAILKSAGAIVILNIVAFSYPRSALYGFVALVGTVFLPLAVTSRESRRFAGRYLLDDERFDIVTMDYVANRSRSSPKTNSVDR